MPRTPQTLDPDVRTDPGPTATESAPQQQNVQISADILAAALAKAIETARPAKITVANRKKQTPWTPKDGSPKRTLKRKLFQHGIPVQEDHMTNEWIDLANKLRPGKFCNGLIDVIRRRDKGINITYPMKTQAQRMRLVTEFGLRDFGEIMARCIQEAELPRKTQEELDLD